MRHTRSLDKTLCRLLSSHRFPVSSGTVYPRDRWFQCLLSVEPVQFQCYMTYVPMIDPRNTQIDHWRKLGDVIKPISCI